MKPTHFWPALAALLLTACQSQEPSVPAPADSSAAPLVATPEVDASRPMPAIPEGGVDIESYAAHLQMLSSDAFDGRAPGTRGERLTVNYLVDAFAGLGLQAGYGDSFLQPVPMVELTNEQRSPIRVVQGDQAVELAYPEQMIINSRRLGIDSHGIEDSELVFVGYGIVAPEYGWDDYAGLDVTGKTVVMLINDPGYATGDPALFNGRAMTYYGRWTYKYEEAARQGAAAALIIHDTEPASYGWDVVINSWSMPQFELGNGGDEPTLALEGWITLDTARALFERARLDFDQAHQAAEQPGFRPLSLDGRATASVRNAVREGQSHNVLALIPGSEWPEEAIVYLAHWDHLGRNLAIPGSAGIYNGAIDNASGTAALIELARLYQAAGQQARSVLFLAVTLEEYGLLGSRYYVGNPVFPPEKTVAAINIDAMTIIGPTEDVVVVGYGASELDDILARAVTAQGRKMLPEPTPEAGFYYRSDHFNFAKGGIPALYARGGVIHREHGEDYGLAQARDYRDRRYHKPGDEFDPDWDLRGVAEDLGLLYQVGRYLAEGEQWPNWREGNEFRAIRDRQRPAAGR